MELRQLRYFVEIANRGSFTKAAEALSIAQPALTAQVHKLEEEFKTRLFVRNKRGIELTEAGRVAHEQAQRTLDAADATMRATQLAAKVASAKLIVGFTRLFPFMPIARTLRRIKRERPDMQVELREMWSPEQVDALVRGAIDVGFVHYTDAHEDRDVITVPIVEERWMLAVSDAHPLGSRRTVALADLANEGFIMPAPTTIGETLRDEIIAECKRAGFEPRVVQESSDVGIILGLVSAGMGVSLLSSVGRNVRARGVHFTPIVPKIEIRFAVMLRRGATATFVKPFLDGLDGPIEES